MRVTIVSETFSPAVNGVVNSVRQVAEQLTRRGHRVSVIAPSGESYQTDDGGHVQVVQVPSLTLPGYRGLSVSRPGPDLQQLIAARRPDVVHLASPAVLGRSAVIAANDLGVPTVAVFQTDLSAFARRYHLGASSRFVWSQLRKLHSRADLTLVPSTASAYQLRAQGIPRLALWARGVDAERFNPMHRDPLLHRELADGRLLVAFVGRLAPEKRVELLEPISRLPGVQLVVVGDGPRRNALQRAMPAAKFLGQLTGADLGRHMASLDLVVHPGADETFCQVIQEALCAGVPVVATASGGPLDLVRHGVNGLLWPGHDADLLAAQVAALRDEPVELARLRSAARRSVSWRTWSRVTDELLGHYEHVRAERRPAMLAS